MIWLDFAKIHIPRQKFMKAQQSFLKITCQEMCSVFMDWLDTIEDDCTLQKYLSKMLIHIPMQRSWKRKQSFLKKAIVVGHVLCSMLGWLCCKMIEFRKNIWNVIHIPSHPQNKTHCVVCCFCCSLCSGCTHQLDMMRFVHISGNDKCQSFVISCWPNKTQLCCEIKLWWAMFCLHRSVSYDDRWGLCSTCLLKASIICCHSKFIHQTKHTVVF